MKCEHCYWWSLLDNITLNGKDIKCACLAKTSSFYKEYTFGFNGCKSFKVMGDFGPVDSPNRSYKRMGKNKQGLK